MHGKHFARTDAVCGDIEEHAIVDALITALRCNWPLAAETMMSIV